MFEYSVQIARASTQLQFEWTAKYNKLHKSFFAQVVMRFLIY